MNFFQINREERHFGFLFLTAIISNNEFRKSLFKIINSRLSTSLHYDEFDVYAEVAIFRDYWNSLGDQNKYNKELHQKRIDVLTRILKTMELDEKIIHNEDIFWTGIVGESKLWFPGRWAESKIRRVEKNKTIEDKKLWRCRWLCNAKPDVMIQSGNNLLFIEIKVESGIGTTDEGYNQEQTQNDIVKVGSDIFDWMGNSDIKRINLSHIAETNGITWGEVINTYRKTKLSSDIGAEMIERHLSYIPKRKIA